MESKTSSMAIRFSVERALKKFARGKTWGQDSDAPECPVISTAENLTCEPNSTHEGIDCHQSLSDAVTPRVGDGGFGLFADMDAFFGGGYLGLATSFDD